MPNDLFWDQIVSESEVKKVAERLMPKQWWEDAVDGFEEWYSDRLQYGSYDTDMADQIRMYLSWMKFNGESTEGIKEALEYGIGKGTG